MHPIITSTHPRFGQVRKMRIDETWFYLAKDVAHALGFSDTSLALDKHCRGRISYQPVSDSLGRIQNFRVLGSDDVVRLAGAALGAQDGDFTNWLLADEILPDIPAEEPSSIITLHEENDQYPVRGRELHQKLGIESIYVTWFKRMCEYGFEEGKDYFPILENRSDGKAGKPLTDHNLTISMAKEICMLQRTPQGRAIRRHLIAVEEAWNSPDAVINRALKISAARVQSLMADVQHLEQKIRQDEPKVFFANAVSASASEIHIGELAKLLKQNGFDTGRTRLFEILRRDGYLMKAQSGEYNTPTQKSMNLGLMRVREETYTPAGESPRLRKIPMVTGKGQLYFLRRYAPGAS